MATSTFWMLETIKQVRADIAPGISGWQPGTEGQGVRDLIATAEVTVGVPESDRTNIRVWLIDRLLVVVAPPFRELGLEAWEDQLPRGQFNAAMIAVEASLQDQYDDEQAEEPD